MPGGARDEDDEDGPAGDGPSDAAGQVLIRLGASGPLDAFTLTDGGAGDGVGTVSLRFRVGGLFLSPAARDFALLLDEDDFSDAEVHPGRGSYDPVEDTIEFTGVPLAPAQFVALAVRPLP